MLSSETKLSPRVYVLRCWIEPQTGSSPTPPSWRFRMENVREQQVAGFATVNELVMFLQKTFGNDPIKSQLPPPKGVA